MADIVNTERRSKMMAGIKSKDTGPELAIRRGLHSAGFRFRLHSKNIAGKPDIVLSRYRAIVFVNGCFWHGHCCSLFRLPGTKTDFWEKKISRNRERDIEVGRLLKLDGWRRLTIWECSFRGRASIGLAKVIHRTVEWLIGDQMTKQIRGRK